MFVESGSKTTQKMSIKIDAQGCKDTGKGWYKPCLWLDGLLWEQRQQEKMNFPLVWVEKASRSGTRYL